MTRQEIKDYLYTDREFVYNGKPAAFCPIGVFVVGYAGGNEDSFETIDEALDARVFDGKSIIEIWDEIKDQI